MAGRGRGGRGRGGGVPTFMNKEMKELLTSHGLGRGEELPPPLYDRTRYTRPVPLSCTDDQDYLVTVRQLFREAAKNLPYYLKVQTKRKDVECYSDKYLFNESHPLQPVWSRLPAELNTSTKRRKKLCGKKLSKPARMSATEQISSQLEELEKKEQQLVEDEADGEQPEDGLPAGAADAAAGDKKKVVTEADDDDDETVDEDEYDEMEKEEDNDYAKNYYESDDSRGDDEDDNLDADGFY